MLYQSKRGLVNTLALFLLFVSPVFAIPTTPSDKSPEPPKLVLIEGIWESDLGVVYTIEKKVDIYLVRCTSGDVGVGRLVGNTFTFGFGGVSKAGLAVYHIEKTDREMKMVGEWTIIPGNGKWSEEILTLIKTRVIEDK